jgi:hypothetical protein
MNKSIIAAGACLLALSACSSAQVQTALSSPAGQLFCAVQTSGGGTIVAGLIDAEATAAAGAAAPVAVLATGVAKAKVDADCAAAGGIAVSPPANPAAAPQVAIVTSAVVAKP